MALKDIGQAIKEARVLELGLVDVLKSNEVSIALSAINEVSGTGSDPIEFIQHVNSEGDNIKEKLLDILREQNGAKFDCEFCALYLHDYNFRPIESEITEQEDSYILINVLKDVKTTYNVMFIPMKKKELDFIRDE